MTTVNANNPSPINIKLPPEESKNTPDNIRNAFIKILEDAAKSAAENAGNAGNADNADFKYLKSLVDGNAGNRNRMKHKPLPPIDAKAFIDTINNYDKKGPPNAHYIIIKSNNHTKKLLHQILQEQEGEINKILRKINVETLEKNDASGDSKTVPIDNTVPLREFKGPTEVEV